MKTLFQEETSQNNKTPGQTAMKGLFAENKESEPKTPNQVYLENQDLIVNNLAGFDENLVPRRNFTKQQDTWTDSNERALC